MGEPAALHAVNLVVHTTIVVEVLLVLPRLVVASRGNGPMLRSLIWVFWGLLGFFTLVWLGRVEAILDFLPDFALLDWARRWVFLPELVLVYGLGVFWGALRRSWSPARAGDR